MFAAITDWAAPDRQRQAELLRARPLRCDRNGRRAAGPHRPAPFARRASQIEARTWGRLMHHLRRGNRCWLYYRQPRRLPQFLVLDYVISTRESTLATFRGALNILDDLARAEGSDAILCDVATGRISDRLLARWGGSRTSRAGGIASSSSAFTETIRPPRR